MSHLRVSAIALAAALAASPAFAEGSKSSASNLSPAGTQGAVEPVGDLLPKEDRTELPVDNAMDEPASGEPIIGAESQQAADLPVDDDRADEEGMTTDATPEEAAAADDNLDSLTEDTLTSEELGVDEEASGEGEQTATTGSSEEAGQLPESPVDDVVRYDDAEGASDVVVEDPEQAESELNDAVTPTGPAEDSSTVD